MVVGAVKWDKNCPNTQVEEYTKKRGSSIKGHLEVDVKQRVLRPVSASDKQHWVTSPPCFTLNLITSYLLFSKRR